MADYLFIAPATGQVIGLAEDFDSLRRALESPPVADLDAGTTVDVYRVVGSKRTVRINEETVRRVEIE